MTVYLKNGFMKFSCLVVLSVNPVNEVLPSESLPQLLVFAFLTCEIEADFELNSTTVESRWIAPNETVVRGSENPGKYAVSQGPTTADGYESVLLIQQLIYSDANTYTCEVRDIRDPSNRGDWMSFQVTLQLLGKDKTCLQCARVDDSLFHPQWN